MFTKNNWIPANNFAGKIDVKIDWEDSYSKFPNLTQEIYHNLFEKGNINGVEEVFYWSHGEQVDLVLLEATCETYIDEGAFPNFVKLMQQTDKLSSKSYYSNLGDKKPEFNITKLESLLQEAYAVLFNEVYNSNYKYTPLYTMEEIAKATGVKPMLSAQEVNKAHHHLCHNYNGTCGFSTGSVGALKELTGIVPVEEDIHLVYQEMYDDLEKDIGDWFHLSSWIKISNIKPTDEMASKFLDLLKEKLEVDNLDKWSELLK